MTSPTNKLQLASKDNIMGSLISNIAPPNSLASPDSMTSLNSMASPLNNIMVSKNIMASPINNMTLLNKRWPHLTTV